MSKTKQCKRFTIIVVSVLFMSATKPDKKPIIWVLGDSTACSVPDSKSKPPYYLMGWAQMLQSFFDAEKVSVDNRASPGESSRSFFSDKNRWPAFKDDIKEGDFVVIQFGHNDEKFDIRHTEPGTTYKEFLSKYIDHARKAGAIPVLATSIERNRWKTGKKEMNPTHGEYPKAMRELAKDKNVTLVDLTILTRRHFEKIGWKSTTLTVFFPGDGSHLQKTGAIAISKLFVDELVARKAMPICSWVKESPCNPNSIKVLFSKKDNYRNFISYSSAKKTLRVDVCGRQNLKVNVVTLNGKSILSEIVNLQTASTKMEIPIHGLSRGTYLIKSEFDGVAENDIIHVSR